MQYFYENYHDFGLKLSIFSKNRNLKFQRKVYANLQFQSKSIENVLKSSLCDLKKKWGRNFANFNFLPLFWGPKHEKRHFQSFLKFCSTLGTCRSQNNQNLKNSFFLDPILVLFFKFQVKIPKIEDLHNFFPKFRLKIDNFL